MEAKMDPIKLYEETVKGKDYTVIRARQVSKGEKYLVIEQWRKIDGKQNKMTVIVYKKNIPTFLDVINNAVNCMED